MLSEASAVRRGRAVLSTNCRAVEGIDAVADALCAAVLYPAA
jgi:urease accessory protein